MPPIGPCVRLHRLLGARESAGPCTPDAASEALRIGPCHQPRSELGHGNGCVGQSGGAHFASHALDLVFGSAHDGEAEGETWEETGCAHPDRWPLVFLDETDAARPLRVRVRLQWKRRRWVPPPEKSMPKSLPTVATLRCSPSSSSKEASRLAKTGLDATICDLGEMRNPLLRRPARSSRVASRGVDLDEPLGADREQVGVVHKKVRVDPRDVCLCSFQNIMEQNASPTV